MAAPDPLVTPLAEALLACYATEIAKVSDPPAQVCLRTGDVVNFLLSATEDECCEGLAWVRAANVHPTIDFPEQQAAPLGVAGQIVSWAVVLELGAVRCAPTPGHQSIPSCDEWTALTEKVNDDAAAMRRAMCCFAKPRRGRVLPGLWEPLSVEGGCTGSTMTLTVRAGNCDCDQEG